MAENVGRRLLSLRELYGISQRELAKRAGVPNSAISVIEHGKSSPSISSLEKVLAGFPMSVQQFLNVRVDETTLHIYGKEGSAGIFDEQHIDLHLYNASSESSVQITPGFAQILVVSGQIKVSTCNQVLEQATGDRVGLDRDTPFRIDALTDDASWVYAALRIASYEF
jgi:transcriptional regulator with XRE-family HTH domain